MKRSAPMKRTGFKRHRASEGTTATGEFTRSSDRFNREEFVQAPRQAGKGFRYGAPQVAALFRPVPKDSPLEHRGYERLVRNLPCARCGVRGYTQFCHGDIIGRGGKGKGIKSDVRLGWPGCGPHGKEPGCHWFVGTSGNMFKAARHLFEAEAARATREVINTLGLWPADLPQWKEIP